MRIGFDAKRAFSNQTGLGNYSRTLLNSLATYFPQNQYFLYAPQLPQKEQTKNFFQSPFFLRSAPKYVPKSLWRSRLILSQLQKDKLDIYHGLSHELPFGIRKSGIKSIVTIHDLIFLRFPELYPYFDRKIYYSKIRFACQVAHTILAISEQTKKDIIQYFDTPPEKIKVIYQSCSEAFSKEYSTNGRAIIREKYNLPTHFLLYVGTIEKRKNLILIAKALSFLPKEIKCVVIGKKTSYFHQVNQFLEAEGLKERVIFLSDIPFPDLPPLYQSAEVFLYPSRFEGFGIPILEALCSGTPVIAATGSCLEEAGGPNSIYVNPDDEKSLAEAISQIWENPQLSSEMSKKGKVYSQQFSRQQIAHQLMELYQSILV